MHCRALKNALHASGLAGLGAMLASDRRSPASKFLSILVRALATAAKTLDFEEAGGSDLRQAPSVRSRRSASGAMQRSAYWIVQAWAARHGSNRVRTERTGRSTGTRLLPPDRLECGRCCARQKTAGWPGPAGRCCPRGGALGPARSKRPQPPCCTWPAVLGLASGLLVLGAGRYYRSKPRFRRA